MTAEHEHRLKTLIQGLVSRTAAGEGYKWTSGDGDSFELALTRTTLQIASTDNDGAYPYAFAIVDENGRTVEAIFIRHPDEDPYGLRSLYDAASRSSRNVEEKLNEIFFELGIEDTPYSPPKTRNPFDDSPF